ncbi:MAG: hypothetical protein K8L97_23425 [Anaerolineae bacterium]|nr:hypothetical protein [Anaerolineae bacterium]
MNPTNSVPLDELTAIKGIGASRQKWLQKTFNVQTYHDLANLSAEEIESRLKAEGKIVSHAEIETWIAQAQHLATVAVKNDGWQPIASFVVEFQEHETETGIVEQRTKVHHVESDHTSLWAGIQQNQLCHWMIEQLGDKAPPPTLQKPLPVIQEARIEQAVAKVEALTAPSTVPPFVESPDSGSRLEAVLAKVQKLTGQPTAPPPVPIESHRSLQDVLAQVGRLTAKAPPPPPTVPAPPRYGVETRTRLGGEVPQHPAINPRIQRLIDRIQQRQG